MTATVPMSFKEYRRLVGIRYWTASNEILKGLEVQCGKNDLHFLTSLRSFIEYNRRGIWFLAWANKAQTEAAAKLTFDRSGTPSLIAMDKIINNAMGFGAISHLEAAVQGMTGKDENFVNCLHALTHGNPISVRMLGFGLDRIFQTQKLLERAQMEQNVFTILLCRHAVGDSFHEIWKSLATVNNKPDEVRTSARIALKKMKAAGIDAMGKKSQ